MGFGGGGGGTGSFVLPDHTHTSTAEDGGLLSIVPIGVVLPFAGQLSKITTAWKLCDGSAISRTTYSDLFDVIGTLYGVGDGATTFNIPDFRGKFPRGAPAATEGGTTGGSDSVTLSTSQMPSHSHGHSLSVANGSRQNGTGSGGDFLLALGTGTNKWWRPASISGSISSTGGSSSHENRPSYQELQYIIKVSLEPVTE